MKKFEDDLLYELFSNLISDSNEKQVLLLLNQDKHESDILEDIIKYFTKDQLNDKI
jgi:hypothetical protein